MVTVTSLVEFLLSLLRDPEAQAEFEQNPEAVLARNGLDGLCLSDVTDAAPLLADRNGVQASMVQASPSGHAVESTGPVQEINHITKNYTVDHTVEGDEPDVYNIHNVDDRDQIIQVDDSDTTNIQAGGDVNIDDSFNQDNDSSIVDDSFNEDNDGLDNKGGDIDDSNAGGGGSINLDDDPTSPVDESSAPTAGDSDGSMSATLDGAINGDSASDMHSSSYEPDSAQQVAPAVTEDVGQDQMVEPA